MICICEYPFHALLCGQGSHRNLSDRGPRESFSHEELCLPSLGDVLPVLVCHDVPAHLIQVLEIVEVPRIR